PPDAGEDQIAALARELETAGSGFEALSGAPRTVTVLDQAAHILRSGASHAPAAAELIQSVLRKYGMALLTDILPGAASPPLLTGKTGPAAVGGDAFDSGMWPSHRQEFLGDPAVWRNDPAVTVLAPGAAEDSSHVPFLIDATAVTRPI